MITGQLNLKDALDRTHRLHQRRGQGLRAAARRGAGHDRGPAARLAPGREAHPHRRRAGVGQPDRLRAVHCHSAQRQLDKGKGPYFYLAKNESHLEARLWNDAFNLAQDALGIPRGTIRATVLIETIPAAFEMEEILYELREHSAGLNAGPLGLPVQHHQEVPHPGQGVRAARAQRGHHDRAVHARLHRAAGQDLPPARARTRSAAWPRSSRAAATPRSTRRRWPRCATTRPASPATASTAPGSPTPTWCRCARRSSTACSATGPNQLDRQREDVTSPPPDLLAVAKTPGAITEAGLRNNISVALQYLATWLGGNGAVAIFNLMEDAATAEISRSQIWQWIHNDVALDDGPLVTRDLVERLIGEELAKIRASARRRLRRRTVRPGGRAVHRGRAGRQLRRVPDHPGLRADAVTGFPFPGPGTGGTISTGSITGRRRAHGSDASRLWCPGCGTSAARATSSPTRWTCAPTSATGSPRTGAVPALVVLPGGRRAGRGGGPGVRRAGRAVRGPRQRHRPVRRGAAARERRADRDVADARASSRSTR